MSHVCINWSLNHCIKNGLKYLFTLYFFHSKQLGNIIPFAHFLRIKKNSLADSDFVAETAVMSWHFSSRA